MSHRFMLFPATLILVALKLISQQQANKESGVCFWSNLTRKNQIDWVQTSSECPISCLYTAESSQKHGNVGQPDKQYVL